MTSEGKSEIALFLENVKKRLLNEQTNSISEDDEEDEEDEENEDEEDEDEEDDDTMDENSTVERKKPN